MVEGTKKMSQLQATEFNGRDFIDRENIDAMANKRILTLDSPMFKLFGISMLAMFLRIHTIIQEGYWSIDEPSWRILGNLLAQGNLLYKDIAIQLPPMMLIIYSLFTNLFDPWVSFPVYAFGVIWIMMSTILIGLSFFILKRQTEGLLAAFFFAVFSTFWNGGEFLSVNGELICNGFFAICLFLTALNFRHEQKGSSAIKVFMLYMLMGLTSALAASVKAQAGILLISMVFYLVSRPILFEAFRVNYKKQLLYPIAALAGGFLIPVIFFMLYFYFNNALDYAIHFVLSNQITHASEHTNYSLLYFVLKLLYKSVIIILTSLPLWIFAVTAMLSVFKDRSKHCAIQQLTMLATLWAVLTWIPTSMGNRFFSHYFILFLVPLCFLAATVAVKYLADKVDAPLTYQAIRIFSMIFIVLSTMIWFVLNGYSVGKFKEGISTELKVFIESVSEEKDSIFIWGYSPKWYLDVKRNPSPGFYSLKQLVGAKHVTRGMYLGEDAGAWERLKTDIWGNPEFTLPSDPKYVSETAWNIFEKGWAANPPRVFVDTSPAGYRDHVFPVKDYPRLKRLLKGYRGPVEVANTDVYFRD